MLAVLLATSEDGRLKPLTERLPAPMLPVANRPVMGYTLESLARQGCKKIVVSVYHLASIVEGYFGTGERWGLNLQYSLQRRPLGSAGALRWARSWLNEAFLVAPADALYDFDLCAALDQHRQQGNAVTVIAHPCSWPGQHRLRFDKDGRLIDFGLPSGGDPGWFDTGIYVLEPEMLDRIPLNQPYDLHTQLLPELLADGKPVRVHVTQGYWNPLSNLKDYVQAQNDLLRKAAKNHDPGSGRPAIHWFRLPSRQISEGVWVGRNTLIDPSAEFKPPVLVGENTRIGRRVELGPFAIVGNNVIVDQEASIDHSLVFDRTYVGRLVKVSARLVDRNLMIDAANGESVRVTDAFLLNEVDPGVVERGVSRALDVILSLLLIIVGFPGALLLGLASLLASGRLFQLQTVNTGPAAGRTHRLLHYATHRADGQLTRLGAFLERLELHRWPELWNVLKGDLSFVGVMPLTIEQSEQVGELWLGNRGEVRPGFTGLWYVQPSPDASLEEVLVTDAYYGATRSFRGDLRLIWQTPGAWLRRVRHAYSYPVVIEGM